MKLKKITLTNYKQHRNREIDLDGTLCAVIGHNGCGKSNMLGAIQFALSGEQPGFTKQQLVSWGETDGKVVLEFEHQGKNIVISRNIVGASVTLKIDDEVITGSKKVEEALRNIVNIDKDLLKQVVFVRQSEVDSILFTDPRQRELSFQRLMGIGEAAKIHKELGAIIQGMDKPENFDEAIIQAKNQLSTLETNLKSQDDIINDMEKTLAGAPNKSTLQASIDAKTKELQVRLMADETTSNISSTIKMKEAANLERAALKAPPVDEKLQEAISHLSNGEQLTSTWTSVMLVKLKAISDTYAKLTQDEAALGFEEIKLANAEAIDCGDENEHELVKLAEDSRARESELIGELNAIKPVIEAASNLAAEDDINCPMCGSNVKVQGILNYVDTKARSLKESLNTTRATLEQTINEIKRIETAKAEKDNKIKDAKKNIEILKSKISQYKIPDEFVGIIEFSNVDYYKELISQYHEKLTAVEVRIAKLDSEILAYDGALDVYIKKMDELNMSLNQEFSDIGDADLTNDIKAAQDNINTIGELETALATARGVHAQIRSTINMTKVALDTLVEKKSGNDVYNSMLSTLTKVRDWFHYSNGPHTMAASVMDELNQTVNGFLEQFTAPFVVLPADEGIGFKCRFTDGRKMPEELPDASVLSGGQKVQLAVAFRMAVYCLFASKLGLLSLDEPTAYLDEANISKFGDLLQVISKIAKNMGVQVLFATHEESLLTYADKVIDLTK